MAAYLTLEEFTALTVMPAENLSALEAVAPDWIAAQLERVSRYLDARLAKRYGVPFGDPAPATVQGWVEAIVTVRCYLKRGVDPTDAQWLEVKAAGDTAVAEIKEAANSDEGLFELPLREGEGTAVSRGGPFGYSEASPYVWTDVQADAGHDEDAAGSGSGG